MASCNHRVHPMVRSGQFYRMTFIPPIQNATHDFDTKPVGVWIPIAKLPCIGLASTQSLVKWPVVGAIWNGWLSKLPPQEHPPRKRHGESLLAMSETPFCCENICFWWWIDERIHLSSLVFRLMPSLVKIAFCVNLHVQWQSTNMSSQYQYLAFEWRHKSIVVTSQWS